MAEAKLRQRTATQIVHYCSRWKGSTPASLCGPQRAVHMCRSCTRSGWRVLNPPKSRRCCTPATGAWSPAQTAWISSGDKARRAGGDSSEWRVVGASRNNGSLQLCQHSRTRSFIGAIFVVCEGEEYLHTGEAFSLSAYPFIPRL